MNFYYLLFSAYNFLLLFFPSIFRTLWSVEVMFLYLVVAGVSCRALDNMLLESNEVEYVA